ncbi:MULTISPECIES: NfeD family protein [Polaromonas]|uniref:NfeD family protein n=1 Tax=Polaromonas aquatica TaxID=332657 RepID=A0ABW1TYX3_9BURK
MAESTIWWLLAGAAVAIELATGTFYLLMLCMGMVAAAISAHLGLPVTGQIITAAIVGGGAVALWHWRKSKQPKVAPVNANPDVHIDIGEPVQVERWNADGTASVKYRGANWTAVLAATAPGSPDSHGPGQFRIKEMQGSRLVIEKP